MKRLAFAFSIVFAFGAMCTGAPTDEDEITDDEATDGEDGDGDKEVVVVPVPDDGEGGDHWCCEYEDDDGDKKFALVAGAAECNDKFADQDGRWTSGSQCTPCCCKSGGDSFELTTPASCADVGECVSAEGHAACETDDDEGEEDGDKGKGKEPERPVRKGPPVVPGSSGGARRPEPGDKRKGK